MIFNITPVLSIAKASCFPSGHVTTMISLKLGHTKGGEKATPQHPKYFKIREFTLGHAGVRVAEYDFGLSSVLAV